MKKRAAMLLAGMMVLSLAVPCAAGAEETNDSEYYYVNGKAPEEVTGNILFWSWDPNFFDMVQKMNDIYPNVTFDFVTVASADDYMQKLTGVTCRMFCRWEDLREAVKEAKDLTQGGEEYLACSAKVISAIEFIRNNYARQICLEDIAEYAGVSRVYLSQIFKKETGKNISDYLVEYRLGKAKELLLNSNLKIYTIAELCGFGSAQYFNKIFKKMNGISPYQLKDNKLQ